MAVYKPKRSPYFHYDFIIQGGRFHGSTGQTSRRQAEAYERRIRTEAAEHGPPGAASPRDLTVDVAIGRWWHEKGQHLGAAADYERHLEQWVLLLGGGKRLGHVRRADILRVVALRRQRRSRGKLPSPATVNRFVAAFRAVWRYVDDEDRPLPRIRWGDAIAPEGNERVRELSTLELRALCVQVEGVDWLKLFIEIKSTYGFRFGEMFFRPEQVDGIAQRIVFQKRNRKKPVDLKTPLATAHRKAITLRAATAAAAGLDSIWYEVVDGEVRSIDRSRIARLIRKKIKDAGISDLKIHDLRHHAATSLLRETGNLKLVKEALGHASIQSTLRYAHVSEADLLAAFEATTKSRNSPGRPPGSGRKQQKK